MKVQKEIQLDGIYCYDRKTSKKDAKAERMHKKLNENNETKRRLLEKSQKSQTKATGDSSKVTTEMW